MKIGEIKETLKQPEYDFLKENEKLKGNLMLVGLGGSHAYGTDMESSDLDIRGIAFNPASDILLGEDFEQVVDENTDTTIYSFNKMLSLLSKSNPNTIEILGLEDWQYLYLHPLGKELLENKKMFLSKICIYTFGGYSTAQFRRLENKAARLASQEAREKHILESINNASYEYKHRYFPASDNSSINLYIDDATNPEYEKEIFMDINLSHYPLRDYAGMWNEMKSIVSSYNKIGKRNGHAIAHDKLGKHMMHLIRLYMMCIDILEKEDIITYRREEHDLLMEIRNGKYLDENSQPISAFYDLVNEYEKKLDYAKKNTSLPDVPDYKKINEFKMYVNEKIVKNEL